MTILTDIAIRNLKAGESRREIPDPGCAGLYVVVQPSPSGRKSFAVRYRFDGKPRKLTLKVSSLAAARKLAADALYQVAQGSDPAQTKQEARAQRKASQNDPELRRVWQATEEPSAFNGLVRFILLTGCRKAEATGLRWSEIAGDLWTLPADRNKVKVDLTRPLSGAALAIVKSMPVIDDGPLVFSLTGHRVMDTDKPLARLQAASETEGWSLHDLRRSHRTLAARCGIDSDTCERCLGHTLPAIRAVYDRHKYLVEMKRTYAEVLALVGRIVEPPPANVTPLRRRARA
jgi:integrase